MNNLQFQKTATVYPRTWRKAAKLNVDSHSGYRARGATTEAHKSCYCDDVKVSGRVFGGARPLRHKLPRRGIPVIAGAATRQTVSTNREREGV